MDSDIIIVGAGLAGLVAAAEAADRGRKVIVLDQEGAQILAARHSGHWAAFSWSTRLSSGA